MKSKIAKFLALIIILNYCNLNIAHAAISNKNQAVNAVKVIQASLNKDVASLNGLTTLSQSDLSAQTSKNQTTLDNFESGYKLQKASADLRTTNAINVINQLSFFVVQVSNLSRCNGLCTKGSVINLPFLPNDDFTQQGIDQNVKSGAITPQNQSSYDAARVEYSKSLENSLQIYSQYLTDKKNLEGQNNLALLGILTKYQTLEAELKSQIDLKKTILLAAKRALSSGTPYETNFKTSYIFQFNVDTSYEVANSPFSTITSWMSAKAVVSAADDYSEGFRISQNFNIKKAANFNKKLTGAYTDDPEFKKNLAYAIQFYRNAN